MARRARRRHAAREARRARLKAHPFDPKRADAGEAREAKRLIRAMAVAGFASMNIMLMAVSVWAGNVPGHHARDAGPNLSALRSESAAKICPDGSVRDAPLSAVSAGDRVLVRPGDRVAVDGMVEEGASEIDQSLVTGENALTVRVTAAASGTLLDEVDEGRDGDPGVHDPHRADSRAHGPLGAFLWAMNSGQYDDIYGAEYRILSDDDRT